MANPIIKIKRGAVAPTTTLQAGEFAIDQVAKNLYLGVEVGGVVTNEIVAGSGTFATKSYVDTAVSTGTGSLGTMSTQNADAVAITGGTIDGVTLGGAIDAQNATITYGIFQTAVINSSTEINDSIIDNTPIGATTPSTGAFTTLTASSAPSASTDVVRKTDLDSAVSALGSVFRYVGNVSLAATPFDLATLPDISTGAYYRVDVAGTYVDATYPDVEAKVGDAFVFTAENGFQKLDNVDVVVSGTTDEISVTGDENTGYTVALATEFKDKVSDLEIKTQNIDISGTIAGATKINGDFTVDAGGGAYMIRSTGSVVELNENGNLVGVRVHSTLDLVDSDSGLGDSTDGFIALQAAGHLVGVNHTYGGSSQMSKIENFIIDGGVY
jgi:hypothetical protein